MDRMLAFIIIFLVVSITLAGVLVMGAVPKIFQNAEIITDTKNETTNQTEIILKQFQRENNTTQKILKNQNLSLSNQIHLIQQNHDDIIANHNLSKEVQNITDEILKISQEHKQVAKDHDLLAIGISNVTNYTQKELERYGENSIEKLQTIVDNQEKIIRYFDILINQTDITP